MRFKSSYYHGGRTLFLDFESDCWWLRFGAKRHGMLLQSFDFCAPLSQLAGALGRDRIKVLLYEDLSNRPEAFLAQLGEVFGQDLGHLSSIAENPINVSKKTTRLGNSIAATLNRRLNGKLTRWLPEGAAGLSDDMRLRLLELFAPSNEKLFVLFGLDNRYSYY